MTDKLSNNIPTPFTLSGTSSVLPDSPPPQEVAVNPIPPLPSMSASAANPPSKFGAAPEPKVETVVEPDPPKPVEKSVTSPVPAVPEEDPGLIRPPGSQSAAGGKSSDTYVKKHHGLPKTIIAGVVALVFLVIALGGGLYLTSQKQDLKTLADNCSCINPGGACSGNRIPNIDCNASDSNPGDGQGQACCVQSGGGGGGGGGGGTCPAPDTNTGACAIYRCYGGCSGQCSENRGDIGCDQVIGGQCGQIDEECRRPDNSTYWRLKGGDLNCSGSCSGGGGGGPTSPPQPTSPPGPTEPSVPTATPVLPTATSTPATISANCQSLVGQISNGAGGWVTKTDADFAAQARPGDGVRFVCTGHKTQGAFTKSAFFINGTLHVDDVVKLNADQYAVEYTIPAAGSLEIESVLLHDSEGWVD